VAAVPYVDPGNFATKHCGRRADGYMLLWVVLTPPHGDAHPVDERKARHRTGLNLAEVCREKFPVL